MSRTQKGVAHVRTQDELKEHLHRQIGHLRRSGEAYDKGELSEAERLAVHCYLLLQDSKHNKPLLEQLGLRSKITFVDEANHQLIDMYKRPNAFVSGQPLITMRLTAGGGVSKAEYAPHLGQSQRPLLKVDFQTWWNGIAYINQGLTLTRGTLVQYLRNQDGGGHVDDHLRDPAYHRMATNAEEGLIYSTKGDSVMLTMGPPDRGESLKHAHWATMRQIAWEVDESLKLIGL